MHRIEEDMEDNINNQEIEQVIDERPGQLEVDKTNQDILIINSIEDLIAFSYNVNNGDSYEKKTVKLGKNLDFNSNKSYVEPYRKDFSSYGYNDELKTELIEKKGFTPIGNTANSFKGIFDGNNKKIKNILIASEDNTGFFGIIENATVKNLNISGKIKEDNKSEIAGGVVAAISNGTNVIENCICEISVSGIFQVGGIVGLINGSEGSQLNVKINQCYNYGNIVSEQYTAGGICGTIGYISKLTIINCGNEGNNVGYCAGGIIGTQTNAFDGSSNIYNCYNFGIMKGSYSAGGIIGQDDGKIDRSGFKIKNTYSNGNIIGTGNIMGALAAITSWNEPIIEKCYWKEGTYSRAIFTNNISPIEIESTTEEEMKSADFLKKLNDNREDGWNKWIQNSDKYPIIKRN